MKIKYFALLFVLLFAPYSVSSQHSEFLGGLYNIGIGASIGAVGSLVNKGKNEDAVQVMLKGFWQGGLGGYITYESKNLLRKAYQNEDWKYYWGSKILNAIGTSIKENAAHNRNFWAQWNLHFGFIRLEFHTQNQFSIKPKIMPISLGFTIYGLIKYDFEPGTTLTTGQLAFSVERKGDWPWWDGYALPGIFVTTKENINNHQLFAHEIVHQYQSFDFLSVNSFIYKPFQKINDKFEWVNLMSNYVFIDSQVLFLGLAYQFGRVVSPQYWQNIFEREAYLFSYPRGYWDANPPLKKAFD